MKLLLLLLVVGAWVACSGDCRAEEADDTDWAEALIPAEGGRDRLHRTAVTALAGVPPGDHGAVGLERRESLTVAPLEAGASGRGRRDEGAG